MWKLNTELKKKLSIRRGEKFCDYKLTDHPYMYIINKKALIYTDSVKHFNCFCSWYKEYFFSARVYNRQTQLKVRAALVNK